MQINLREPCLPPRAREYIGHGGRAAAPYRFGWKCSRVNRYSPCTWRTSNSGHATTRRELSARLHPPRAAGPCSADIDHHDLPARVLVQAALNRSRVREAQHGVTGNPVPGSGTQIVEVLAPVFATQPYVDDGASDASPGEVEAAQLTVLAAVDLADQSIATEHPMKPSSAVHAIKDDRHIGANRRKVMVCQGSSGQYRPLEPGTRRSGHDVPMRVHPQPGRFSAYLVP